MFLMTCLSLLFLLLLILPVLSPCLSSPCDVLSLLSQLGPKPSRPKPSRPKTNSAQNQVGPKPTRPKTHSALDYEILLLSSSLSSFLFLLLPSFVLCTGNMPILTCIFFSFNWLTLTSEMHFVKFQPEVTSCLLSRGKRKYATLVMRLVWKYINYFLVYHLISYFLLYLQNYKEFEAEI